MLWKAKAAQTAAAPSPGDDAVEPVRPRERADRLAQEQHDRHVGERVEAQVEEVGQRRRRRRGAAQGLDGEHDVADRPAEERRAEDEGDGPTPLEEDASRDAQPRRDELEGDDRPAVEPRPGLGRDAVPRARAGTRRGRRTRTRRSTTRGAAAVRRRVGPSRRGPPRRAARRPVARRGRPQGRRGGPRGERVAACGGSRSSSCPGAVATARWRERSSGAAAWQTSDTMAVHAPLNTSPTRLAAGASCCPRRVLGREARCARAPARSRSPGRGAAHEGCGVERAVEAPAPGAGGATEGAVRTERRPTAARTPAAHTAARGDQDGGTEACRELRRRAGRCRP